MKHFKSLFFLLGFISLWGCTDNEIEIPKEHETTLKVSMDDSVESRVGFDAKGKFYWSEGDQLGVTSTGNPQSFSLFTMKSEAGSPTATFTGLVAGEPQGYAVYPFHDWHEMQGSTLHYFLKSSYEYSKVDNDFFIAPQGTGNSFNPPMWSKIEVGGAVKMKHLGGVICIKVDELPIGENLKLVVSSRQKMNGNFTASLIAQTPVLTTSPASNEAEGSISFLFKNDQTKKSGVFYAPVPTGTYEKLRVKLFSAEEPLTNTAIGNVVVNRGKLKIIQIKRSEISGGDTGTDPAAAPAAANLLFGSKQDTQDLTLNMNSNWHVEVDPQPASAKSRAGMADWIEISPMKGSAGNVTISTKTTENLSGATRKGRIKIVSDDDDIDLDVMQVSKQAMVVAKPKYVYGHTGGSIELDVDDLDDNFTIETTVGWIVNKSLPDDDDRRLFEVQANLDASPRYGQVIFTSGKGKGKAQQVIDFEQAGNDGQSNPGTNPGGGILIVSSQSQTFDSNRHEFEVEVLSKVPFQVETPSLPWIKHIETIGQKMHFVLEPNATYESRNALIRIYNVKNNQMAMLSINQMQKDAIVLANPMYQFTQFGGDLKFHLGHNVEYDMSIDVDWITQDLTRAFVQDPLIFKIAENKTNENREGHITFTSKDKAITQSVLVKQAQVDAMIVEKTEFKFDDKETTFSVNVNTNIEFQVINDVTWIHQVQQAQSTRNMVGHNLQFNVDKNSDYSERTGILYIRSNDMKQKVAITVTQAQHDAIVLPRALYTVDYKGGPLTIETQHNVDYTVTTDNDWITYNQPAPASRALADKNITVNVAQNPVQDKIREGLVILTSTSGVKAEVTVRQLPESMQHEVNVRKRLTEFYKANDGDNWWQNANWCSEVPLNEWYGVTFKDNLLTLDLSHNNILGNVDLSNFDELYSLNLNENTITSLNVSSCARLDSVWCDKSSLEQLNPTNSPALQYLSCANNKLKTIPLEGNGELKVLHCTKNQINSIDLSPVEKLTILEIGYNQGLKDLRVNHLKLLTLLSVSADDSIERLDCSEMPKLESLICTSCDNLYHLKLNGCVSLSDLEAGYNYSLRSLNISDCNRLERLYANDGNVDYDNTLEYIVVWDGFIEQDHTSFNKPVGTQYLKIGQTTGTNLNVESSSFKASLLRLCDINMDDQISIREAALVKSLSCNNSNISGNIDLSPFCNLEFLSISNNKVTGINLGNCTKLKKLYCYQNMMSSLDLTNCTDLTLLHCYSNQLATLDVSKCSKLQTLYCYSNALRALDISNCGELTELQCYQNQLTSLNLTNTSKLKALNCEHNSIESLDLKNCTALTNLHCEYNQLVSLDLPASSLLTSLSCSNNLLESINLTNSTELTYLQLSSNKLKTIDLTKCLSLTSLYLYYTPMTELDISLNKKINTIHTHWDLQTLYIWKGYNRNSFSSWTVSDQTTIIEK